MRAQLFQLLLPTTTTTTLLLADDGLIRPDKRDARLTSQPAAAIGRAKVLPGPNRKPAREARANAWRFMGRELITVEPVSNSEQALQTRGQSAEASLKPRGAH